MILLERLRRLGLYHLAGCGGLVHRSRMAVAAVQEATATGIATLVTVLAEVRNLLALC